jgi:hypothetical protein
MMSTTMNRLLLGVGLALLGIGLLHGYPAICSRAVPEPGSQADVDASPIVVPFKMLPSNHIVVETRLNGKGPYRFIFDLGAPVTLVNGITAEESGAIPKNMPRSFMMGVRGEGKVESLQLGDLKATDVPVIVMDHPALKALSGILGRPLVGIIGYTFWARFKMTIDYQAKQMTFVPIKNFEVRDLMKDLPARLSGPKTSQTIILSPRSLWGLTVAEPHDGLSSRGVPILKVVPGSPADTAGLKPGDTLVAIGGRWTTSVADTYAAAQTIPAGQLTKVVILHDGTEVELSLTPAEGI